MRRRTWLTAIAAAAWFTDVLPKANRSVLLPFEHSAFPYSGNIPDSDRPFLDAVDNGRLGHTTSRGGVYFQDDRYSDPQSLMHWSHALRSHQPGCLVIYFHGNNATLYEDVIVRQQLPSQFDASHLHGALFAPQLARNALDSSAGRFWEPQFFAEYLKEAERNLARSTGIPEGDLRRWPVVIMAYSGGYDPAAYSLEIGGAGDRVQGVILMDALFGELPRFYNWIVRKPKYSFFVSAYSDVLRKEHGDMRARLKQGGISVNMQRPANLRNGGVWFIDCGRVGHMEFMSQAWVKNPVRWILSRMH